MTDLMYVDGPREPDDGLEESFMEDYGELREAVRGPTL